MIKKYSKIIPEEYLAVRWKENNWDEVKKFVGDYNIKLNPHDENTFFIVDGTHDTYEEMDFVHMGDYLVKRGRYGFPYSVKAEIFEKHFHFEGWDMT